MKDTAAKVDHFEYVLKQFKETMRIEYLQHKHEINDKIKESREDISNAKLEFLKLQPEVKEISLKLETHSSLMKDQENTIQNLIDEMEHLKVNKVSQQHHHETID